MKPPSKAVCTTGPIFGSPIDQKATICIRGLQPAKKAIANGRDSSHLTCPLFLLTHLTCP